MKHPNINIGPSAKKLQPVQKLSNFTARSLFSSIRSLLSFYYYFKKIK